MDQIEHFLKAQSKELLQRKNLPVECETCGEVFVTISELNTHMRSHTGNKPFECDICNQKFTNDQAAKLHIMNHMGKNKLFKCPMCSKDFKRYSFLRTHITSHSKQKISKCRICKESFPKDLLKLHVVTHQNTKNFFCDICNRGFVMIRYLNEHKKIHCDDKFKDKRVFKCDICGNAYVKKYSLARHMSLHTEEKPFQCNICKEKFRYRNILKSHKKIQCICEIDKCSKDSMVFEQPVFDTVQIKVENGYHSDNSDHILADEKDEMVDILKKKFKTEEKDSNLEGHEGTSFNNIMIERIESEDSISSQLSGS